MASRLAVVLVNWNGWRDTIACLESLRPTLPADAKVVVCDNASQDDSMKHLTDWAAHAQTGAIPFVRYNKHQAEQGGPADDPQLVLIDTGGNLGFAGGNNVGMRYALATGFDYVWLLNNDTVVDPQAASELIRRMQAEPGVGMCGSTVYYHDAPDTVQCLGGSSYDFRRAVGTPIGFGKPFDPSTPATEVEAQLDYVAGASMMVSRVFLETIGLMDESYFLYFEEIDWATRARGRYKLGWAPRSIVWHKEGGSIGSSHRDRPSDTSLAFICANRLKFTRTRVPQHYRSVQRQMLFETLVYAKRRDWRAVSRLLRALRGIHPAPARNA